MIDEPTDEGEAVQAQPTGAERRAQYAEMEIRADARRRVRDVKVAIGAGIVLSVIGVLIGVIRMLDREVGECPDGTSWPLGETDFDCYVHPHLYQGALTALVCALLGILIGLVGYLVLAAVRGQAPTPEA